MAQKQIKVLNEFGTPEDDPLLVDVVRQCWESGEPTIGYVNQDGSSTVRPLREDDTPPESDNLHV